MKSSYFWLAIFLFLYLSLNAMEDPREEQADISQESDEPQRKRAKIDQEEEEEESVNIESLEQTTEPLTNHFALLPDEIIIVIFQKVRLNLSGDQIDTFFRQLSIFAKFEISRPKI